MPGGIPDTLIECLALRVDGRRERADASRSKIIAACMLLSEVGEHVPSPRM